MTKRQTRKYEMLVRVQTFGVTHQKQFAEGSEVAKAFATVTDAVAQINAFEMAKLTARRESMEAKLAAKLALAADRRHRAIGTGDGQGHPWRRRQVPVADAAVGRRH